MIEQKVLENLGLSEKEAKVYLSLIELGTGSVVQISKTSQIKRPTTYLILDELKKRGIVTESQEKNRTTFAAEDPSVLEKNIKQNLANFSELLPFLRAKYNRGQKPKIRFIEGKENLYRLYTNEMYPSKHLFFFGSSIKKLKEVLPNMLEEWDKIWWPKKKKAKDEVLEIVSNEPEDIQYAKDSISEREIRILPKEKHFLADNAVTENKIFIISLESQFAVVIESEDLAQTYRTLVELAWQSAIPADEWED